MSARWEIDLSPGAATVPRSGPDRRAFKGLAVPEPCIFKPKSLFDRPLQAWQTTRLPTQPFFMGSKSLVKADLGLKRVCPSCGSRFYDLQKRPIECPKCAFSFEPEALYKQRRPRQPEPVVAQPVPAEAEDEDNENEDEESEEVEEIVEPVPDEAPLVVAATGEDEEEEAAEETETEGTGMAVVDEDELEDIVVEDDDEEEDDSLLEDDEDENDDVSGIIDADIEKDER